MKYEFKTEPYAHQKEALLKSWKQREYALFMEMGTGKSKVLIDNMAILYGKGAIDGTLIVAPKGVYRNWSEREIPTHLPDTVAHRIGVWNPAPKKKEKDKDKDILIPQKKQPDPEPEDAFASDEDIIRMEIQEELDAEEQALKK